VKSLTRLQFLPIVTEDGVKVGHVLELRSAGAHTREGEGKSREISEVIYGRLGLLQRLGLRPANVLTLPWSCVQRISDGKLVVRLLP